MGNMDNKAELLHNNQVGKEDIYNFKCKKCGKCCYNHTGIILTPYDLFWAAVKLNTSTEDIVSKYCYRYIGDQSKLPIVSIKAGSCPFHTPTGCMLGEMKPTICRMYPLGRGYVDGKIVYFNQPVTCGDKNPAQTVDDWLKLNDVFEENERFSKAWYDLISKITLFIHERNFTPRELEAFQGTLIPILYMCYDTKAYFWSQFLDRKECIERILKEI